MTEKQVVICFFPQHDMTFSKDIVPLIVDMFYKNVRHDEDDDKTDTLTLTRETRTFHFRWVYFVGDSDMDDPTVYVEFDVSVSDPAPKAHEVCVLFIKFVGSIDPDYRDEAYEYVTYRITCAFVGREDIKFVSEPK